MPLDKTPHHFKRNDTDRTYELRVGGSRLAYSFPYHRATGTVPLAFAQLVEAANVDRAALYTISGYAERMDNMCDAYHSASIIKRLWWALRNNLPYSKKV